MLYRNDRAKPPARSIAERWLARTRSGEADVCIVVEGCYPFRGGGVSVWLDALMRDQSNRTFSIVSLQARGLVDKPVFEPPDNLASFCLVELGGGGARSWALREPPINEDLFAKLLLDVQRRGSRDALEQLIAAAQSLTRAKFGGIAGSKHGWRIVRAMYEASAQESSFLQYYWAWQTVTGGLIDVLAAPLPPAKVYHAASTGFGGLMAARAAIETGRPMLLTEHGIYVNERVAEVLDADWISERVELSLSEVDHRRLLRDVWIEAFTGYARIAYEVADEIISLFPANQVFQRELGAAECRLSVIANGVDCEALGAIGSAGRDAPPTVALIGRGDRIKDIETFVRALASARRSVPGLRAVVLGGWEDEGYRTECESLIWELGLSDCLELCGRVDVADWLAKAHLVVLTSISEAQPFALMEAGAAGIACIATDVGDCRRMLEGEDGEAAGGIIVAPLDVDGIAAAMVRLMRDHGMREQFGRILKDRIRRVHSREVMRQGYAELYRRHCGPPG